MQTLTFTQKLLRQRRFLSFLFPLFAVFVGLGISQPAMAQITGFISNNVTIVAQTTAANPSTSTVYDGTAADPPVNPAIQNADLGGGSGFSLADGSLTLSAAFADISTASSRPVLSAKLSYRVYLANTASQLPGFSDVMLSRVAGSSNTNPMFENNNANVDLLTQPTVLGGGTYKLEIQFSGVRQATSNPSGPPVPFTDPIYSANFSVTSPNVAPPGSTTIWIGGAVGAPNDWLTPANWSNGVPSVRSNAIIPSPPRPNPPILNNNTASYSVKDLTLQVQDPANAFTTRGILRVTTATLKIYGDISNGGNGILATTDAPGTVADPTSASAIVILAGGNQKINQGRFANLVIQNNNVDNSTGIVTPNTTTQAIKSNFGVLEVPGSLTFTSGTNALLRSTVSDLNGNLVLDTGGNENVDLKNTGSIIGETNTGFVLGIVKVQRPVNSGIKETFGGVGIDITIFGSASAGIGQITRATGATFSPVSYSGATRPVSVKRSFGTSFSGLQTGFNADVVFHYNNNAEELNTNRDGFLSIFRTTSGSTFQRLGGVNIPDPSAYPGNSGTVEVAGLNNINTLTLADYERNPLPVTLSSLAVKREDNNAVVNWSTAQELNSKGFNVQVSTNGTEYRTVGFVASTSPNSTSARSYSFTDTEKNKVGLRYYRLQQVDVDGKSAYSVSRAVTFEGRASELIIAAYPNPYDLELRVSLNSVVAGDATISIRDMTGRVISQRKLALTTGSNDMSIDEAVKLKSGIYLLNVTLPSGETKTMKVVKQ